MYFKDIVKNEIMVIVFCIKYVNYSKDEIVLITRNKIGTERLLLYFPIHRFKRFIKFNFVYTLFTPVSRFFAYCKTYLNK